jgi:hypothetical protein
VKLDRQLYNGEQERIVDDDTFKLGCRSISSVKAARVGVAWGTRPGDSGSGDLLQRPPASLLNFDLFCVAELD